MTMLATIMMMGRGPAPPASPPLQSGPARPASTPSWPSRPVNPPAPRNCASPKRPRRRAIQRNRDDERLRVVARPWQGFSACPHILQLEFPAWEPRLQRRSQAGISEREGQADRAKDHGQHDDVTDVCTPPATASAPTRFTRSQPSLAWPAFPWPEEAGLVSQAGGLAPDTSAAGYRPGPWPYRRAGRAHRPARRLGGRRPAGMDGETPNCTTPPAAPTSWRTSAPAQPWSTEPSTGPGTPAPAGSPHLPAPAPRSPMTSMSTRSPGNRGAIRTG